MRRRSGVSWKVILLVAVGVVGLGGAGAAALPSPSDDTISACVQNSNGKLRVVGESEQCKRPETRLTWNREGPAGPKGETGATGPKGDTGATGPQGLKGDTGATGAQGLKGETGATGAQGLKGDTGATGATGSQGLKGDTGPQGLKGDTGATGAQGLKGDTGATGATGPQGERGPAGPTLVAQGVILADGTLGAHTGPEPTVTKAGAGAYQFELSGMGTGCPLPSANAFDPVFMFLDGGACGGGHVLTTLRTSDGTDRNFAYVVVGGEGSSLAAAKTSGPTRLPDSGR